MESLDFENTCRICLNEGSGISLNVKLEDYGVDYLFLLNMYASIKAKITDFLPSKICRKCGDILQNFYTFRKIIIENDAKLKDFIRTKISDKNLEKTLKEENYIEELPPISDIVSCITEETPEKTNNATSGTPKAVCQVCGKNFQSKTSVYEHMSIHTKERPFHCDQCGKTFRTHAHLKGHRLTHTGERNFECEVCHKRFAQDSNLKIHRRVHSGEKPDMCTYCGRCFSNKGTLLQHKRTHTGEYPHQCNQCDKGFRKPSGLKNHIQFHHENIRNWDCEVCEKAFFTQTHLKIHMESHQEKKHKCDICNKMYSRKDHLNKHLPVHFKEACSKTDSE